MELQRALSDLAEVRERLAHVQRFEGYSGPAAAASGLLALIAGCLQYLRAPLPQTPAQQHAYLTIWLACLVGALALNYGAVVVWVLRHHGLGAQSRFRTAALSIAPSVVLGGALTVALADHGAYALLPGTWFALYTIGLFASRNVIPESAMVVAAAFGTFALAFLLTPLASVALAWWVMPLGFGGGQLAIGALLWRTRAHE